MEHQLQLVDEQKFISCVLAVEAMLMYGYSGTIPFRPTDELTEENIRLGSRNAPIVYDGTRREFRLRLNIAETGLLTFIRIHDSAGTLLAQITHDDFGSRSVTAGSIFRMTLPEIQFTLKRKSTTADETPLDE